MALTQAEKMVVGYVKRYPNEADEPFTEFDIEADQVEENELDKPVGDVHLEVRIHFLYVRPFSLAKAVNDVYLALS